MSAEITSTLPDTLFAQAQLWGEHFGRSVPRPIESWSDEEVLSACDAQMEPADDARLGELPERRRESQLLESESAELRRLMGVYQEGLLHKAMATQEAVQRRLREPPAP